jgi:hypothetical protein
MSARACLPLAIVVFSLLAIRAVADPPCAQDPQTRAGHPQEISRLAVPASRQNFTGGYVGGSCLVHGDARGPQDGTWGWDYVAFGHFPNRIFLGWCHCRNSKTGPYATDGHHVKDPVAPIPQPHCEH